MINNVLRLVDVLLAIIRSASSVLLICSVALNFANIVGRYFLHSSIPWAEESMLFLMIGCVFLGSTVVTWSGRHIRMDIIVRLMPEKVQIALNFVSELVLFATAIVLVIFAWPVIRQLVIFDQRSLAANIPLAIPQAMIPVGLLFTAFFVIVRFITSHRNGQSDA